jgi:hypothetical protein
MASEKKPPAPESRPASRIKIGDQVLLKSHFRRRKSEVFEVVDIVTVTILNSQKRVQNIHVSNLELVQAKA